MSYTLRGRLETRLAALLPVVVAGCLLTALSHRWWPVEAAALMVGLGVALDSQLYQRLLAYQPGWCALPMGALELGALLAAMRLTGVEAPPWQALAFFAGGWLLTQALAHAAFPLARLDYVERGGELGRLGGAAALVAGVALAAAGGIAYAGLPPVVRLAAGVTRGPLVISRREVLEGAPGAVVRGGIVVRADDVTIRDVVVVGGEDGIEVDGVHGTVLDGVSVSGAKLDGIHVVGGGVMIRNCSVDMEGNPLGEGINISYNMGMGMSMVEGCSVDGGMEGIATHSSTSQIVRDHVSGTRQQGIVVTEMSMGTVMDSEVTGALGIGIYCNDRSTCMIEHNTVVGTRPDIASGNPTRKGYGVLASFQSLAELRGNHIASNPVPMGAVIDSELAATH